MTIDKNATIESIIDSMTEGYKRPMSAFFWDNLKETMSHFADWYGYDRATIYEDFKAAMFLRNRTGERVFNGIAY